MSGDVVSRLGSVLLQVLQSEGALLHQVVEVGDLVSFLLLLLSDEFVSH